MVAGSLACAGPPGATLGVEPPDPRPGLGAGPAAETAADSAAPAVCAHAGDEVRVAFPDPNLERAIRQTVGLTHDESLTCGRLAHVRSLHAPDARIGDLTGIQSLPNLEVLYIYGNNSISDLTPLTGLPALRDLGLARNDIEDLGPLLELRGLTSLDLLGNPIRDLGPLAALTRLTRLRVAESPEVRDLEPLARLTALTRLELDGNAIVDVGPLAGLAALTRLSLQGNRDLADVGPLRHLGGLEILLLGSTSVSDLSPLGGLGRLDTLGLEGTAVRDLGALIGLTNLSRLDLRGNRALTDIQPLLFNTGLGPGDTVRLEWTGVRCEDVGSLQAKGVTVLASCR